MAPFRFNLSSRARELTGGDAVVVSIPKSGRTWVRTFLCAYFCRRYNHPFTLEPEQYRDARIPRVVYSHDLFEQQTKADWWDRLRGKYLVPASQLRTAHIILLVRDPRDAFVSHYLQLVHRSAETPDDLKNRSLGDLLRDKSFGIEVMISIMNIWLVEFTGQNFSLIRYEALRENTPQVFRELLGALGEQAPAEEAFQHALAFSDFNNMQKLEAAGAFESKILRPGDVQDPESFKVRRGKVGGFQEYLSAEDLTFATAAMKKLDSRFGYAGAI